MKKKIKKNLLNKLKKIIKNKKNIIKKKIKKEKEENPAEDIYPLW